jgi:hypothetical protein
MWYLTKQESQAWCEDRGFRLDEAAHPVINERAHSVITSLCETNSSKPTWHSEFIASYLEPFNECLLGETLWGLSENLHLFYLSRESYGECRHLADAPDHLFFQA